VTEERFQVEWATELSRGVEWLRDGGVPVAVLDPLIYLDLNPDPQGDCELRAKSPYFAVAWQTFIVTKSNAGARCEKAMEGRLALQDDAVQSLTKSRVSR
jgi:hypothetical protein